MKRNEFIATLRSIHHQSDPNSSIECYREMGKVCKLADYFDADNKFYKLNRKTLKWEFLPKPPFSGINNGFVAVNVEVPSTNNKRSPIIPFFSIAINKKGNDSDELRQQVLTIAQNSASEGFLTGSQFVNNDHIERIIFEITIRNGKIERMLIPAGTPPTFYNEKHRDIDAILKDLWENHENSFVQSWCEPFFGIENGITLYCNIRAVDWDSDEVKSHSIFVCMFESEDIITDWVSAYGDDAMNIIAMLKSVFISDIHKKQMMEAEKSAKAAIMSRNMSHNLGSHVMAYLKQKLGSVTTILSSESEVLADLLPNYIDLEKVQNIELPFLVGVGRFIGYLQERQDYIATISTDYIPYGAPVNFKDAIYDELNPDLRFLRHKVTPKDAPGTSNDANNKPANILLNYIAKSEGLSRENMGDDFNSKNDIRFGFVRYVRENEDSPYQPAFFGFNSFKSTDAVLSEMRKISVSLPGGLIGRQAVFSIIENLIRNAAKHGDTSSVDNLDFTFDIIDGESIANNECVAWEQRISDPHWRQLYENASDLSDLFIITITDNLITPPNILSNLTQGLYEDFVDPKTGRMTTANKGLKELRISAAWLRADTNEDSYMRYDGIGSGQKAPLIGVELSSEGHLRYVFCVRRTKLVAVISEITINRGKEDEMTYQLGESLSFFKALAQKDKVCWSILTWDEYIKSDSSFSFVIIPDNEAAYNAIRPFSSNRVICWNEDDNQAALHSTKTALCKIYQKFTGINENSEDIFIDDGRAFAENNTREAISGKIHFKKIRFDAENIDHVSSNIAYLYTTHLSNEKDYIKFANSGHKSKLICAEGITGDNSSDRLVRREPLDETWYYSHLHAMKQRIAIIDERIFKMVHNIDEGKFVSDDKLTYDKLMQYVNDGVCSERNIIKVFQQNYKALNLTVDEQKALFIVKKLDDIKEHITKLPYDLFKDLLGPKKTNQSVTGTSHLTPYYKGKNIDIFTMVRDVDGKIMLVGCVDSTFDGKQFCNIFDSIATFEYTADGDITLNIVEKYKHMFEKVGENGNEIDNRYDYISIHQGILDKVYEVLEIKHNDAAKLEATTAIHKVLMKDNTIIDGYLPRFIIHSGRAKPTKEDMPQKQPFVQYAAIENAVKDCKLMLVDLLDYAKYEES